MECPQCNASLKGTQREGLQLDLCAVCDGIWFDAGELEAFSQAREIGSGSAPADAHHFVKNPDLSRLICPTCESNTLTMGEINSYEAGLCSACGGVWLRSSGLSKTAVVGSVAEGAADAAFWLIFDLVLTVFD